MDVTAGPALRLDSLLHRSAAHEVWSAHHPTAGTVAVKRCLPGSVPAEHDRLRSEARLLESVSHPNVVEMIDLREQPAGPVLVLALVGGGSLRDLLDHRGALSPGELVAALAGVSDAVSHLSRLGIVHADLKPGNVLLEPERGALLADLGSAVLVGPSGRRIAGPQPAPDATGTVTYLDPRVVDGGGPDAASEVFSLGVLAYECLTGRPPHRGSPAEVLALAAAGVHRPLGTWPTVPGEVAAVVERALSPAPDDRPTDAAAFARSLREVVDPHTVVLPTPPPAARLAVTRQQADQTVPFGPKRPDPPSPDTPGERWRSAAAALIAMSVAMALWVLAGLVLGV